MKKSFHLQLNQLLERSSSLKLELGCNPLHLSTSENPLTSENLASEKVKSLLTTLLTVSSVCKQMPNDPVRHLARLYTNLRLYSAMQILNLADSAY